MATVLMALPAEGFDPTESGVPWKSLVTAGHDVVFATPDARPARVDTQMLDGEGLGLFAPLLVADRHGRDAFAAMAASDEFASPRRHRDLAAGDFDLLLLPGGHAPGMRDYLESTDLQALVAATFAAAMPVAAICHGVVLAARSQRADGRSVLHGRRTTALLARQELLAWRLTRRRLGDYYRTYPQTVEAEVGAALAAPGDFVRGPLPLWRDAPGRHGPGFSVRDGAYLSARWPGDAHRFAAGLPALLECASA